MNSSNVEQYLNEKQFYSLLEKTIQTTKHGTHIDWAFSNFSLDDATVKVYKTIHSHHDALLLAMK